MKKFTFSILVFSLMALLSPLQAQSDRGQDIIKNSINEMVSDVEKADNAADKRVILNKSLDKLITAIDRVEAMKAVPDSDKTVLSSFKEDLSEKKNELNGMDGYRKVPNNQLNNFANFIQQDFEQADKFVTLSLSTVLLIVIILLLL